MGLDHNVGRAVFFLASCALASCSHYTTLAGNLAPCQGTVASAACGAVPGGSGTAITGSGGAPAPASFGPNPLPTQLALPGGPDFSGNAIAPNTSFPVLASTVVLDSTGVSNMNDRSVAATILSATPGSTTFQLAIPALGLSQTFNYPGNLAQVTNPWTVYRPTTASGTSTPATGSSIAVGNGVSPSFGMSYASLGIWTYIPASTGVGTVTAYAFGYETPAAAMPTGGTASFSGHVGGVVNASGSVGFISGDASFSLDFAAGKISGGFKNVTASDLGDDYSFNDVSVTANIASGTNKFSGATGVTSTAVAFPKYSMGSSATGTISGAFYGPAAQQLGAIWSLSDGTKSAVGVVGAGR